MYLVHGTWIPDEHERSAWRQEGAFYLWVETDTPSFPSLPYAADIHPRHLMDGALETFLAKQLGMHDVASEEFTRHLSIQSFLLPTVAKKPAHSLDLLWALGKPMPRSFDLAPWRVCCYRIPVLATTLKVLHALVHHQTHTCRLGGDVLFWRQYMLVMESVLTGVPIPVFMEKTEMEAKNEGFHLAWTREMLSDSYETIIQNYAASLPDVCVAGATDLVQLACFDRASLLRHFAECFLSTLLQEMPFPARSHQQITRTLVYGSLYSSLPVLEPGPSDQLNNSPFWQAWRKHVSRRVPIRAHFTLCFRLEEAEPSDPDAWPLRFLVVARQDPSLQLCLDEYWRASEWRQDMAWPFGPAFEQNLLVALGHAARIYPALWRGLSTGTPDSCQLTLEEAFAFLKERGWMLRDAGYTVMVPAGWTPEGRRRAMRKLRLKISTRSSKKADFVSQGYLSLKTLLTFSYALEDQAITEEEWEQLVNAKTPLVQFRGEWIELDREHMQELLAFWQQKLQGESHDLTLPDLLLLKSRIQPKDELALELDWPVQEFLSRLQNKHAFTPIEDPQALQGILREYQKRGVAWLQYLESLDLNPCLADQMGLGKSLEVIACLLKEREGTDHIPPTLIIAPTSVLGNWRREIERFAPQLRILMHHGGDRLKDPHVFGDACQKHDIILTSFALTRLDARLLQSFSWHRVVIDEAQNIKNPQAAQTRAILKLNASHRLALTGTPVENRLRDLWSIFNFLNPGYLGKEAQFREVFELPIQRGNDQTKSALLKKMVEPFILRRVKTDKQIIDDLPEKIEQKMYCTLSPEQASLYQAVVKDVGEQLKQLKSVKDIRRRGLILSTLLKLKQICNHPAQFLQDGSAFTPERSHKLQRLAEMIEEVIDSGESALIFTQFTEIGDALQRYLEHTLHYTTYYLHGGTSVPKRNQMVAEFQDPETEPSLFILSLRAGGVGLNLTKANHVFHFDRWWNPAVEDQATDRAFRIGQRRNVFVHKFLAMGTMEERIDAMIEDKKQLSSQVLGTDESWLTELDNETFQDLIALRRSAVID